MTTFQDPQPQSRRAVRQSERTDSSEQSLFTQDPASGSAQYYDPTSSMWDTTARRAAQLPASAPRQDAPAVTGRRAAPGQPALPEPLSYTTQAKAPASTYDAPSFRANRDAQPDLPPTEAISQIDQPTYRSRDFSPEGRRAAPAADPSWGSAPEAAAAPPSDLDYHTEARARLAAQALIPPVSAVPVFTAPAPVAEPAPTHSTLTTGSSYPIEETLSRRELRAMRQAEEAALLGSQVPELVNPSAPQPVVATPAPAPISETPFEALLRQTAPDASLTTAQPAAPAQATYTPPPAPQAVAPAPSPSSSMDAALAEFDALTKSPAPAVEVDEPAPWTPPAGHWSTQLDQDDEDLPETTINRRIGSGHTATSALVLPSIPLGSDIRGPLTGTGEIMLTGSIDLPRSLSSTGKSDRFDNDGIDALFDVQDHEVIGTDSSPVRAIRAVSTHTSGHGVTHTQKPKGTKALTALLIAASSMAVVVAGLLVAAFAFNVF